MFMTLPVDDSSLDMPPAGSGTQTNGFAETQRRVEEVVANRLRERGQKDDIRRALYRRQIDCELGRVTGSGQPGPLKHGQLKSAGRVAICGFAAFLVVLWALGPATLDVVEAVLVAAGASLCLGIVSLAIVALCDRPSGHPSDPADPHPMTQRKDDKALRRLF